jgi:hypothetical protein
MKIVRTGPLQFAMVEPFDIPRLDHINAVGRLQASFD